MRRRHDEAEVGYRIEAVLSLEDHPLAGDGTDEQGGCDDCIHVVVLLKSANALDDVWPCTANPSTLRRQRMARDCQLERRRSSEASTYVTDGHTATTLCSC